MRTYIRFFAITFACCIFTAYRMNVYVTTTACNRIHDYMSNIAKSDSIEIPYKIMRVTSVLPSIGGRKRGIGWCIGGIAFSAMLFASSFLDLKKK